MVNYIKPITNNDLAAINSIQTIATNSGYNIDLNKEFLFNPYTRVIAFEINNNIVGFVHYNFIIDRYEINNIIVKKEFRCQKIASTLLDYIIDEAHEHHAHNITLEVREDNLPAINLYEKMGFIKKAIRKGYYNGINGILMEKELM